MHVQLSMNFLLLIKTQTKMLENNDLFCYQILTFCINYANKCWNANKI